MEGQAATLTVAGRLRLEQGMTALTGETVAYVPLGVAQTLAGVAGRIDHVEIALSPGADVDHVKADLAEQLGADIAVARAVVSGGVVLPVAMIQAGLAMVGAIMLFAAAFVIMNAFAMSVTTRTREIGAMRALGMTRQQIMRLVLGEAMGLGLTGAVLGLLAGIGLSWGAMHILGTLDDGVFAVPWWGGGSDQCDVGDDGNVDWRVPTRPTRQPRIAVGSVVSTADDRRGRLVRASWRACRNADPDDSPCCVGGCCSAGAAYLLLVAGRDRCWGDGIAVSNCVAIACVGWSGGKDCPTCLDTLVRGSRPPGRRQHGTEQAPRRVDCWGADRRANDRYRNQWVDDCDVRERYEKLSKSVA